MTAFTYGLVYLYSVLWRFVFLFNRLSRLVKFCQNGFSIIEVMCAFALIGVMTVIALANFRVLNNDIQNASNEVQGFIKKARARAIASTMSYRIVTPDDGHLVVEYSNSCRDDLEDFQRDRDMMLSLPAQIKISPIADLCFNPRGITKTNTHISLSNRDLTSFASLEVGLAGSVKAYRW